MNKFILLAEHFDQKDRQHREYASMQRERENPNTSEQIINLHRYEQEGGRR